MGVCFVFAVVLLFKTQLPEPLVKACEFIWLYVLAPAVGFFAMIAILPKEPETKKAAETATISTVSTVKEKNPAWVDWAATICAVLSVAVVLVVIVTVVAQALVITWALGVFVSGILTAFSFLWALYKVYKLFVSN